MKNIVSVLSRFFRHKNDDTEKLPEAPETELRGKSLDLYVEPIVHELHTKTPRGLKYLKEACSK